MRTSIEPVRDMDCLWRKNPATKTTKIDPPFDYENRDKVYGAVKYCGFFKKGECGCPSLLKCMYSLEVMRNDEYALEELEELEELEK